MFSASAYAEDAARYPASTLRQQNNRLYALHAEAALGLDDRRMTKIERELQGCAKDPRYRWMKGQQRILTALGRVWPNYAGIRAIADTLCDLNEAAHGGKITAREAEAAVRLVMKTVGPDIIRAKLG